MRLLVVLLCAALVPACVKSSDLYCESDTDCADTPATPFCDVRGEFAASDTTSNTCIAGPFDAGPVGGDGDAGAEGPDGSTPQGRIRQIVAGNSHACALLRDSSVFCWGEGQFGALGYASAANIGDTEGVPTTPVDAGGPVKALAAGELHTCAILETGALRCWGLNDTFQLGRSGPTIGDNETPASVAPVTLGGTPVAIGAARFHTCALLSGGGLRCFGRADFGELGYGDVDDIGDDETPAQAGDVPVGGDVKRLFVGGANTCVTHPNDSLRCWGVNVGNMLGYGTSENLGDDETASELGTLGIDGGVIHLDFRASAGSQCAVLEDGRAKCWGVEPDALGHAAVSANPEDTPALALGAEAGQVAVGKEHACALLVDGRVRCWGRNDSGALGLGVATAFPTDSIPEGDVDLGGPATAIVAGEFFTCAVVNQGDDVRCWGRNNLGQLGQGNTESVGDDEVPADVPVIALPDVP